PSAVIKYPAVTGCLSAQNDSVIRSGVRTGRPVQPKFHRINIHPDPRSQPYSFIRASASSSASCSSALYVCHTVEHMEPLANSSPSSPISIRKSEGNGESDCISSNSSSVSPESLFSSVHLLKNLSISGNGTQIHTSSSAPSLPT